MFKKFSPIDDITSRTTLKSSVQRSMRANLLSNLRVNEQTFQDHIWSKKSDLIHEKYKNHLSIYSLNNEPLFFQHEGGPVYPTLKLVHKYPDLLPRVQVDRGAIRFLLNGADMMCPGFTSRGGWLPPADAALPAGTPVAIYTEGKEHAAAVGVTKLATEEMKQTKKGVGVEIVTYLGDELWNMQSKQH